MARELKSLIVEKVKNWDEMALLQAMGYRKVNERCRARLKSLLEADDLGLNAGGYDLKYSDADFLQALCNVLGIESQRVDAAVEAIEEEQQARMTAFDCYLWVFTNFKRANQPVFALAACEQYRYLRFEEDFWKLPLHEKIHEAGRRVRSHMQETGGELPCWGKAQEYWFFYAREKSYRLNTRGDIIGHRDGPVTSGAGMHLR